MHVGYARKERDPSTTELRLKIDAMHRDRPRIACVKCQKNNSHWDKASAGEVGRSSLLPIIRGGNVSFVTSSRYQEEFQKPEVRSCISSTNYFGSMSVKLAFWDRRVLDGAMVELERRKAINPEHWLKLFPIFSLVEIGPQGLGHILLDIVMVNVAISGWTVLIKMTSPTSYTTLFNRFYGNWGLVLSVENQCPNHVLSSSNITMRFLGWKACTYFSYNNLFLVDDT
ncbi:hypothetical protein Tco_0316850 [Tanacetum coccineum]